MANIKDVAQLANVSTATVSRVINNKGYVNSDTKKLVLNAIKELNYVPNEIARSLHRSSSKIIGIIIPDLKNEFFNDMISGMEEVIFQNGYKTMLCMSQEDSKRELEYLQMFSTNKIDGLIICSNLLNRGFHAQLNIPTVTLERVVGPSVASVAADNIMGGRLAARELVLRHCHHLVQFRGPSDVTSANERSKGFLEELSNFENICVHTVELEYYESSSKDLIFSFLKENPEIDGIFAVSDSIAAQALRCLKLLGRKVPEDVQVIGYDNVGICQITDPMLSTIAQPISKMGKIAAATIFKLLKDEDIEEIHRVLPVEFIERDSTLKKIEEGLYQK